jgi:hypothetical protein
MIMKKAAKQGQNLLPKNIPVGRSAPQVIDREVAHIGDLIFDTAFLGGHLALAALARPTFKRSMGATWK